MTPSEAPLLAGAAPELPVVAWCELTQGGQIAYFDGRPMVMPGPVGNDCHPHAMTQHAPAQATIAAQAAEIERLKRERDALLKDEASEPYAWFRQDGSETGVLTLRKDFESHAANYPHMRFTPVWSTPRKSIKAKQVADVEEVMRLADRMMRASWAEGDRGTDFEAAREAFRAAISAPTPQQEQSR